MKYETKQGDMWDLIAYQVYGDTHKASSLIKANIAYRSIYIFPAGIVLDIPELATIKQNKSNPPWRNKAG